MCYNVIVKIWRFEVKYMKSIKKLIAAWILILALLLNAVGCDLILGGTDEPIIESGEFYIRDGVTLDLDLGESHQLTLVGDSDEVIWTSSNSCVSVEDGYLVALGEGVAIIKATKGDKKDSIIVNVIDRVSLEDAENNNKPDDSKPDEGNKPGDVTIGEGGTVTKPTDDPVTSDPYVGVDKTTFYQNYSPAVSYNDAQYRTEHGLMSGSIAEQDQAPTISRNRPTSGGKYVRNNVYIFSEDGNTYYVIDAYGEIAMEIYKGGAYVVLEEVAAYVFAFGEPPANHSASKKTKPTSSVWGVYLRVNHTKFSGDTSKYPYEPVLPNISGCGGNMVYYEMDIGTTGTDCDPSYPVIDYNNGSSIERGAARIVYSNSYTGGGKITDLDERYVFYTYNHYNDFQEYLNYLGGWGEMFGNITGGGTLSSKSNYNPTPYAQTVHGGISAATSIVVVYYYKPRIEA